MMATIFGCLRDLSSVSFISADIPTRPRSTFVVLDNPAHGSHHVRHIVIVHSVKHWQTDQPLVCVLCNWILSRPVAKAMAIVRMKMHWNVVHIHSDILRTYSPKNLA